MKLCHVVASLELSRGGPSRSVRALGEALAATGHDVELLTTAPDAPTAGRDERAAAGLRIRTFRRDWPQKLSPSQGLRDALMATDAAVIHHHGLWLRTLHYAHEAAHRRRAPLVISPRGMMSTWAWQHHRARKLLSRVVVHPGALTGTTAWHATSTEEASDIAARGFHQPTVVSPNGVSAPVASESAAAAGFWRRFCPEVANRRTALFYGRFHRKKRVLELIDVWLEHAAPDWLLLIVGLADEYDVAELEQGIARRDASSRVRVFDGAGRPAPYAVAELFLLPSHNENFGLTVAEAMAQSVPALVTDTTPWAALNAAGCGWCVPWSGYGSALATATRTSAPALAERGRRAQAWTLAAFSWEAAAEKLTGLYTSIVAMGSAAGQGE